jgi:alpha-beta hydrolase superfamily lysophospholipase
LPRDPAETTSPPDPLLIVFGPPDQALFGIYHAPSGPMRRDVGVVLCSPLGYEAMCSHRMYRHLAERLAANAIPALRFDYHGTGDSSGDPDDLGRVGAWLQSINAAVSELRLRSGVQAVVLFGLRFGATLACCAAADRGRIDDLILWAPFSSGREFLRELRALRMIRKQDLDTSRPPPDGWEEAAGCAFDGQTVSAVSLLDVMARQGPFAKRVLIIPRDDMAGSEARLARHLDKAGANVDVATEPGYGALMRDDPQDAIVPTEMLDKMVSWIARSREPIDPGPPPSTSESLALLTTPGNSRRPRVRERAVRFGTAGSLVGIVTEPVDQDLLPGRPAFLFLNVGANHHVGPNRMYVSLSRTLAPLGYLCFRFDVAGLGDSKAAPGTPENRLFSKDSVPDIKVAMNLLQELYGVDSFIVVGLCSGAYLAFLTCLEDSRAVGQVLINSQTFHWKEGDPTLPSARRNVLSTRYYVRALFDPSTWRRAVRGEINVRLVATVMRDRTIARSKIALESLSAKVRAQAEPLSDIAGEFRSLSDRGVESFLLFSFNDGGLDMVERHLGTNARKMRGRTNFHFKIIDGADHTFTPLESQARLREIMIHYATSAFSRSPRRLRRSVPPRSS